MSRVRHEDGKEKKRKYRSLIPPEDRSRNARNAALIRHSRCDGEAATQAARDAFVYEKFAKEVDPQGVLSPAERMRRARLARRAYMRRLAERSARVRKARDANIRARIADIAVRARRDDDSNL